MTGGAGFINTAQVFRTRLPASHQNFEHGLDLGHARFDHVQSLQDIGMFVVVAATVLATVRATVLAPMLASVLATTPLLASMAVLAGVRHANRLPGRRLFRLSGCRGHLFGCDGIHCRPGVHRMLSHRRQGARKRQDRSH